MGETTVVQLPFSGGMDQKTAPEYLDPTSHQALVVNGDFNKNGVISKRRGMSRIAPVITPGTGGTAPSTLARATSWTKSDLTLISPGALYTYSQASASITQVASIPSVRVFRRPLVAPSIYAYVSPVVGDVPYNGRTLRFVAYWAASGASAYKAFLTACDADTGDVVVPPFSFYTGSATNYVNPVGVFALSGANAVGLAYEVVNAGVSTMYMAAFSLSTMTLGTPVAIATGYAAADVAPYIGDPNGGLYIVTYKSGVVSGAYVSNAFAVGSSTTLDTRTGYTPVGIPYVHATYGANIWVTYTDLSAGTYYTRALAVAGGSYAVTLSPITVASGTTISGAAGVVATSSTTAVMTYSQSYQTAHYNTSQWYGATITAGSGIVAFTLPYGMCPVARPFVMNGTVMQPCRWCGDGNGANTLQGTLYVMAIIPSLTQTIKGVPVATIAPRQLAQTPSQNGQPYNGTRVPYTSSLATASRVALALLTAGQDVANTFSLGGSTWIAEVSASASLLYQSQELNSALHISCATPLETDGQFVNETSFVHYPEFAYASTSGTGGSLSGTYSYAVVYVYVDGAGNITRSAPVILSPVTLAGGALATLTIPLLSCTWRESRAPGAVSIEIYRTVSNGSSFYLLGTTSAEYSGIAITTTFGPDNVVDSSITSSSLLYTTGGVLDAVNPPAVACQTSHKGRLWIVDDTLRTVWFTKFSQPGDAVAFNEALTFPYLDGGDITALAELDDKLVIFKATSIAVVYGDGPADTGQGSDLTVPQRIASDVGALDWRSVVLMPAGLMFRAAQGIYLLDRGLNVTYIGKAVEDTLAAFPTVVGASLVSSAQHVRFVCTDGTDSVALVYDYLSQAWSTYVYSTTLGIAPTSAATMADGRFVVTYSNGATYLERLSTDTSAYLDDALGGPPQFVSTSITTPWIKLQGPQAYMRARRAMLLGEAQDSHGLSMSFAVNYNSGIVQTQTWPSAQLGYGSQVEQHFAGAYNKSQAVQITIADTAGAAVTTGAGCKFVGLAIELDNIGQRYRRVPIPARA